MVRLPSTGTGTFTDWHMFLIFAVLMPATATACTPSRAGSTSPDWTNVWPSRLSAETLNCWPETANEAASTPLAIITVIAPAMPTVGTMTSAKRFHLVPPSTWAPIASFMRYSSTSGWDGSSTRRTAACGRGDPGAAVGYGSDERPLPTRWGPAAAIASRIVG